MMVVHEDSEKPLEVAVIKKPLLEQKSYVIVKNHVKELSSTSHNIANAVSNEEKAFISSERHGASKKKKKSSKSKKETEESTCSESDNINQSVTKIDTSDINELKTVYMKCKEVIKRIETKYGPILNLECDDESRYHRKRRYYSETHEDECNCKTKKKIVFDDEGKQSTVEILDKHICVPKSNHVSEPYVPKTIEVEYHDVEIGLPETLKELRELLHDPDIEDTYRNKVFAKIRSLKEEYSNDIRFNKHILIEKLKTNPDEVLNFKGTNLSSIPGYS